MGIPCIIVEVGTIEEQGFIRRELQFMCGIAELQDPPVAIAEIIVPVDFDAAVNRLQNTAGYSSDRPQFVLAKTIPTSEGIAFVLSPVLYTEAFDPNSRLLTYVHELLHAVHHETCPQPVFLPRSKQTLASNFYILLDEYLANNLSLTIVAESVQGDTTRYSEHIASLFAGHLNATVNCHKQLSKLNSAIASLPVHNDVVRFLSEWREIFDELSKSLVYTYAFIDSAPEFAAQESAVMASPLATPSAMQLMEYIRDVGSLRNVDYDAALPLIQGFISEFGLSFDYLSGRSVATLRDLVTKEEIGELRV